MEPLISLLVLNHQRDFAPGEQLEYEYQIDSIGNQTIQAVESSVMWYTEGKGDPDMAVHCFERRTAAEVEDGDLRPMHRVNTRLPNSPLSYNGVILRVCWRIRLRLFLPQGKELVSDQPFRLGQIPAARLIEDGK